MLKLQYLSLKELKYEGTIDEFVASFISNRAIYIDTFIIDDREEDVNVY